MPAPLTQHGNKVPDAYENPIDMVLLRLSARLLPYMHASGHTPNMVTTYSFVCGLGAVWALNCGAVNAFVVLYLASYFFDCMDGQLARTYGMETRPGASEAKRPCGQLGDAYDHTTDLIVLVLLLGTILHRYGDVLQNSHALIALSLIALTAVSFGCQQEAYARYDKQWEMLDCCRWLCPSLQALQWTRFFGTGTVIVLLLMFVIHLDRNVGSVSHAVPGSHYSPR